MDSSWGGSGDKPWSQAADQCGLSPADAPNYPGRSTKTERHVGDLEIEVKGDLRLKVGGKITVEGGDHVIINSGRQGRDDDVIAGLWLNTPHQNGEPVRPAAPWVPYAKRNSTMTLLSRKRRHACSCGCRCQR